MDNVTQTLKVKVSRRWEVAQGIEAFEFIPIDPQENLPSYEAGAHIDVHLPNGLVRQYSLCGQPDGRNRYRIAVLNAVNGRGGSRGMHELILKNQLIEISPPRNAFRLQSDNQHKVLLAGGIGVTPLLAMAYELDRNLSSYELHYFVRSRNLVAFQSELDELNSSGCVFVHVDDEPDRLSLAQVVMNAPSGAHVYACGPKGFLSCIKETWQNMGRSHEYFHFESFSPAVITGGVSQFDVQIASTGLTVQVNVDETVVEALARHGVTIPISCEQGICGTCITGIKSGIPDHRDQYFDYAEHKRNDRFTPCCSRAKSSLLVLDL